MSSLAFSNDAEPHWIRVSSSHFSVLTDGGDNKGREIAVRLEQMRTVFAQLLMKTRVNMPEPLVHDTGIFVVAQVVTIENRVGRALCPKRLLRQVRSWFR